jgi:hypothetical protein
MQRIQKITINQELKKYQLLIWREDMCVAFKGLNMINSVGTIEQLKFQEEYDRNHEPVVHRMPPFKLGKDHRPPSRPWQMSCIQIINKCIYNV